MIPAKPRHEQPTKASSCHPVPCSHCWPTIVGHTVTSPLLRHCCFGVPSLHGQDAGARSSSMRPQPAHPANRAGTTKGVPSRPRCSPAGVHVWPHRCRVLVSLLVPRGHRSAPPFPVWLGQRHKDNIPSASSPHKSPATVRLAACLRPLVHDRAVRARPSASRHPEPSCRSL
jgi:hypothetical protein